MSFHPNSWPRERLRNSIRTEHQPELPKQPTWPPWLPPTRPSAGNRLRGFRRQRFSENRDNFCAWKEQKNCFVFFQKSSKSGSSREKQPNSVYTLRVKIAPRAVGKASYEKQIFNSKADNYPSREKVLTFNFFNAKSELVWACFAPMQHSKEFITSFPAHS